MSLEVLTAIWRSPPCSGGDLLCLLAIADNADESGYAWPSIQTIARKAAMSERGAQKCIRKLADARLIQVEIGGGRGKSNAYQITTNGIGESTHHNNHEQYSPNRVHPLEGQNPEQSDINPEQSCTKPRTPVHPNRKEPSKNRQSLFNEKRKRQISEDEEITDSMRSAADKRGHSQQEAEAQFEKFKNDALAKGKKFVSLDRAFVTWLDSEYFRPITKKEKESGSDRARRIAAAYESRLAGREDRGSAVPLLPAGQSNRCSGRGDR